MVYWSQEDEDFDFATADESSSDDEFALSLDDEDSDDELSDFSFAEEGEEEKAGAESTESLDEADSFFGAEEEEDSDFATADESSSDDEFAVSLDDEDSDDELSDFSFAEEGEEAGTDTESTELFDSEEFVLTPDAEEIQGDEQPIIDANLLENDGQEVKTTVESHFEIPSDVEAIAEILSDNDDEILLDQEVEHQHDRRESEEAELFLTEDAVAKETTTTLDTELVSSLASGQQDDKDQKADTDDNKSLLDTQVFATAAAAVSSNPSLDNIEHIKELTLDAKQRSGNNPQQIVVLHLLESATDLIGQKSALNTDDQVIVQELTAGLELAANDPFELAALVHHYTAWQQELFRSVVTQAHKESKESSPVEQPSPSSVSSDYSGNREAIQQVQEGFSQLRQAMMEEFNQLRKELHKG